MRKKAVFIGLVVILLSALMYRSYNKIHYNAFVYQVSSIAEISFVEIDEANRITIITTLNQKEISAFLSDFSNLEIRKFWNDPVHNVQGYNIKIVFRNGDYHLVNDLCTVYCTDGKHKYLRQYYNRDTFKTLWEKYAGFEYFGIGEQGDGLREPF